MSTVVPPRGRGLNASPTASRAALGLVGVHTHPRVAAALAAGPKGHADLSASLPMVFDQGGSSTCWAHSAANLLGSAHAIAGKPLGYVPSPLYFAQVYYAKVRGSAPGPLQDSGADLATAALVFAEWGDIPMQAPQQSGATDVPATDLMPIPELTGQELLTGARDPFGGSYDIAVDSNAPSLLMATLDAGILVWDGFFADTACENLGPDDILGAPVTTGSGGGHSTLYWGYDLQSNGEPLFYKRNSWGRSWCRGGDFTVNRAHVVNAWELRPFVVTGVTP